MQPPEATLKSSSGARLEKIAENLFVQRYPLNLLGMRLGRVVTTIRLLNGHLIVHSSAPFSECDVEETENLGTVRWLVDATLFHDTFARQGRAAFPNADYFAPPGFTRAVNTLPLSGVPAEWRGHVEVLELAGMPSVREHAMLHIPSRTLILADTVFNWHGQATTWERLLRRYALGLTEFPGMSRFFKAMIKDRAAFKSSLQSLFRWDFDRIIVGHGEIIERDGKNQLKTALARRGFTDT